MDLIFFIFEQLPPLGDKKDPTVALILGFLLGGIGLGLYFRSLVDFVIPIILAMVLFLVAGNVGLIPTTLFVALWGYFRAVSSNNQLG